jgi:hypothetical protein
MGDMFNYCINGIFDGDNNSNNKKMHKKEETNKGSINSRYRIASPNIITREDKKRE